MVMKEYTDNQLLRQLTKYGLNHNQIQKLTGSAKARARTTGTGIVYVGGATSPNRTLQCKIMNEVVHWFM